MKEDKILSHCQATLYRSCLVYIAAVDTLAATSAFKGTKKGLIKDYPLIRYATTNLFIHAEKAADSRPQVFVVGKRIQTSKCCISESGTALFASPNSGIAMRTRGSNGIVL